MLTLMPLKRLAVASIKQFVGFAGNCGGAISVWLFVSLGAAGQNSPQAPLRVSTHLVQIGVIARDSNGPVANLTKDDFVVLDRGKPQKISVFTLEAMPPATTVSQAAKTLPPNTFSDLPQRGADQPRSVTIVLLDNLNTLSGSTPENYETTPFWLEDHALTNAKLHLLDFLKKSEPSDRIAIYGLTDSLHVLCDFTSDRDQLLQIVSRYDATSRTQREGVEPGSYHIPVPGKQFNQRVDMDVQNLAALNNQARARVTMSALMEIAGHVADIPGRKNLLWLTANLPFSGQSIARVLGRANIAAYPVDARGLLPRSPSTSPEDSPVGNETGSAVGTEVGRVLGRNGDASQTNQPIGIDAMDRMAELTGGRAFVNTNDLTSAIRQAVEDSAVTYTLGFYIDRDAIDGKFHELKVEVKRKRVALRYPKAYFAFEDAPATKNESRSNLLAAVRSPIESSVIPVNVRIEKVEKPLPHCLSIFGSIDINKLRLAQNGSMRNGDVDVVTIEQDQTGKVLAQSTSTINLHFAEKSYAAYSATGFPFHQFVQPKPGATTLRILIQDSSTARVGSVIIPLAEVN